MIFYFSATGNCKYVAMHLAKATNERAISITDCIKNNQFDFTASDNENIGIVTPTYFFGLPNVVMDFLQQMTITKDGTHYIYHVLTYYTFTGQAHRMLDNQLRRQGLVLNGKFIIRMPDTFTPIFDLSDKEKNAGILSDAELQINTVTEHILSKISGDFNHRKIPFIADVWHKSMYRHYRKTKKFTLNDSCIGCGICQNQCPVSAIKISDKKATWIKEECALCLGCLHRCPKFAIQYGNNTKKHGQYVNPNVRL